MPYILRRFDYAKTYTVCMYIWPVVLGLPFLNVLARVGDPALCRTPFPFMDIVRGRHAHHSFLFPPVSYHVDWSITFSHRRRVPRARGHLPTNSNTTSSALVWRGLLTIFAISKIGAIPHSLSMPLIKRHAPSQSLLGWSNGLVQFSTCVGRALGPILVSTLFTGVNGMEWVRRWGVAWICAVGMVVGGVAAAWVRMEIGSRPGGGQ